MTVVDVTPCFYQSSWLAMSIIPKQESGTQTHFWAETMRSTGIAFRDVGTILDRALPSAYKPSVLGSKPNYANI